METILIIEDDAKLASLLSTYLSKYGFRTIIVEDFNRALETFNESSADLILLDVNLPKYDGFYWCRQIRSLSLCPILFISARDSGMDQHFIDDNTLNVYITRVRKKLKDLGLGDIVETVRGAGYRLNVSKDTP